MNTEDNPTMKGTIMDNAVWPPPISDLTADQLKKAIEIAEHFTTIAKEHLPDICGKEGHIWDHPEGQTAWGNVGGTWVCESSDFSHLGYNPGHYEGGQRVKLSFRNCTRCGLHEEKECVVTHSSPFKP